MKLRMQPKTYSISSSSSSSSSKSTGLVLFTLIIVLIVMIISCHQTRVNATASTCTHPSRDSVTTPKRSSVLTLSNEDDEEENDDDQDETLTIPGMIIEGSDDDNSTLPEIVEPASTIDTMGTLREMSDSIKYVIGNQPELFNNATGATNRKLKDGLEFKGRGKTPCIACRLNCMNIGVFAACEKKYYFYGCQKKNPCLTKETAKRHQVDTAVGVCIERNGCVLKKLKNMFYYKYTPTKNGKRERTRIKIVPLLPRVYKRAMKLATNISEE